MDFQIAIAAIQLLLGVMIAFMGANLFRSMPAVGGFIIGGVVGLYAGGIIAGPGLVPQGIGFLIGGVAGALIAAPLQIAIIVIAGCALGAVVGLLFGNVIQQRGVPRMVVEGLFSLEQITTLQGWMMLLFAVIFGGLSVRFEEGMLIASTGFLGSLAAIIGLSKVAASVSPIFTNPIFLFFAWAGLGLIGAIWQNYNRGVD